MILRTVKKQILDKLNLANLLKQKNSHKFGMTQRLMTRLKAFPQTMVGRHCLKKEKIGIQK